VSQLSKALSIDIVSPAGKGTTSKDERFEWRASFTLDEFCSTFVADEWKADDSALETGVRGGDLKVASSEANDWLVFCVSGLPVVAFDGALARNAMSSWLNRCTCSARRA
jgi:hypothetical protein